MSKARFLGSSLARLSVASRIVVMSAVAVVVVVASAATSVAAPSGSQLDPGQIIDGGQSMASPSGQYVLTMQSDGNLVEYGPGHVAIWSSNTQGHPGAVVKQQDDGNIVVIGPGNHPLAATGTDRHPGTVLAIQDDGNLVAYAPGHQAIWATNLPAAPKSTPPAPGETPNLFIDCPVLSPGATGPCVTALQEALNDAGTYHLAVDSTYGAATTSTVKSFQIVSGLLPDGVAGPATLQALLNATSVPTPQPGAPSAPTAPATTPRGDAGAADPIGGSLPHCVGGAAKKAVSGGNPITAGLGLVGCILF